MGVIFLRFLGVTLTVFSKREKAIHPRYSDLRATDRSRMAQRGGVEAAQGRGRVADPEDSTRHRTEAAGDAGDAGDARDAGENS